MTCTVPTCKQLHWKFYFIAFLFVYTLSFSQTFYRQYGETTANEGGQTMTALPDGNLAVGGYKNDSAMVMKITPTGDVLWTRTFKPQSGFENIIHCLTITPDNYIIGTGNINNSATFYNFYFKMDLNGNVQWIKRFDQTQSMYFRRILAKSSTQYILCGAYFDNVTNPYVDEMWKLVDAATGSVVFSSPRMNISSPVYVDDQYSAAMGRGQATYITGRTYVAGNAATSMRAYITKVDAAGNHLSSKYLMHNNTQQARVYGVDIIYDNDSLIVGYTGDVNGASSNYTVGLIKTDTLGTVAWAKDYNIASSSTEWCYKVLSYGSGYYITGYEGTGSNDFFIIATDLHGNLLWAKSYGTSANESLKITTTNNATLLNGDIYFTGNVSSGSSTNAVVARVDALGNLGCMTPGNLTVTVTNNPTNTTTCIVSTLANTVNQTPFSVVNTEPMQDLCPAVDLGNDTSVCGAYTLSAATAGATQYTWSDGSTLPTLTVSAAGTYWVVVHAGCCIATDTIVITTSSGQGNILAGQQCDAMISFFASTSGSVTSYQWDFGDGTSSNAASPTHTYPASGTYSVTLTMSTGCGPVTADTVIVLYSLAESGFTYLVDACNTTFVSFTDTSHNETSFQWVFGDGTTSVVHNPTHTYSAPGAYTIMLICNPATSCADTSLQLVTLVPGISAQFAASIDNCTWTVNCNNTSQNAATYQWDFGDGNVSSLQNPTHIYSGPGTYVIQLAATDGNGCSSVLQQTVTLINSVPVAEFSTNSTMCAGNAPFTNASVNAQTYAWDFGDGTAGSALASPSHTYTNAGSFSVQLIAYNTLCSTSDTLVQVITVLARPQATLPPDTTVCSQVGAITLSVTPGTNTVLWSTGSTAASISITQGGMYWVLLNNGFCTAGDSINVSFFAQPSLGADTTICGNSVLTLNPHVSTGSLTWSTGASSSTINVNTAGIYWVKVTQGNCSVTDSVKLMVEAPLNVDLGNDTSFCDQEFQSAILLNAGIYPGVMYTWNTGAHTSSISITVPGTYWVKVADAYCRDNDTIVISQYQGIDLGEDKILCGLEKVELSPKFDRNTQAVYIWSTAETTPSISVVGPGTYSLQVVQGNCIFVDSITVIGSISDGALYVPNTFTPGPDYLNDVFYAEGESISQFNMKIFNRWGELVFESRKQSEGWDGSYKGHPVPLDTYVWVINYVTDCSDGTSLQKKGTITVAK